MMAGRVFAAGSSAVCLGELVRPTDAAKSAAVSALIPPLVEVKVLIRLCYRRDMSFGVDFENWAALCRLDDPREWC